MTKILKAILIIYVILFFIFKHDVDKRRFHSTFSIRKYFKFIMFSLSKCIRDEQLCSLPQMLVLHSAHNEVHYSFITEFVIFGFIFQNLEIREKGKSNSET